MIDYEILADSQHEAIQASFTYVAAIYLLIPSQHST